MQYNVYRNPSAKSAKQVPYVLNVQSDLLESMDTRVVVPLFALDAIGKIVKGLNPSFTINNQSVVMSTTEMATVSARKLGKPICSLAEHRSDIVGALDLLFTGI